VNGVYLEKITKAGLAGMIAGSGPQRVAPHGGTQGRFGTNPIAFGIPSAGTPVIWDIGTAALMSGEVMLKQRLGERLPEGSAFDEHGDSTRDPSAALKGAFGVWGGHKGSGLATVIQLFGMMCGADAAPAIVRDCGFFMFVVDPGLLTSAEDYKQRVSDYADSLRATRPSEPGKPVRVPFERSHAERSRNLQTGSIEVADRIYEALTRIASSR
jgi:LDH2 family malate/lactate/ureidoglycolate dehydrogenase